MKILQILEKKVSTHFPQFSMDFRNRYTVQILWIFPAVSTSVRFFLVLHGHFDLKTMKLFCFRNLEDKSSIRQRPKFKKCKASCSLKVHESIKLPEILAVCEKCSHAESLKIHTRLIDVGIDGIAVKFHVPNPNEGDHVNKWKRSTTVRRNCESFWTAWTNEFTV